MRGYGSRTLGVLLLAAAGCAGPAAPTPPQPVPVEAPKAVLVIGTASPAMVLAGYPATFDASGSRGSGLTYKLDFGDGATSTGPVTAYAPLPDRSWTYDLTATLTVTDRLGRSAVTTVTYALATLKSAPAGSWIHGIGPSLRKISLNQTGADLSGRYSGPEGSNLRVTGTVVGDRAVSLRVEGGLIELTGSLEWPTTRGWGLELRLTMRGGTANGETLKFVDYEPY